MVNQRLEILVPDETRRTRLEDYLFGAFPNLSRMYLREVVRDAQCEVNGRHENVGFRVRGGDYIEIELDPTRETAMLPQRIPLDIVFEDEHLIVVNKPPGMLVHPTHRDKRGTLLNALAFHLNAECGTRNAEFEPPRPEETMSSPETNDLGAKDSAFGIRHFAFSGESAIRNPQSAIVRPGLVHRLDKQTSGLIVVAKSVLVHRRLARQFQKKLVEKKYLALVEGVVERDEGTIEGTIGRHAEEKRWGLKEGGKHSTTRFRVLERNADATLLELEPVTGRTNQLRIHCESIGHSILGDVSRGGRAFERLCLHACRLSFRHPVSGKEVSLTSCVKFR